MNKPSFHSTTTCSHPRRMNLSSPTAASSSDDTPPYFQELNQISPDRVSHSAEETTLDERFEYGKILLGFAFAMLVSLLVANSKITKSTGASIAVLALSFALPFTGSGLLLRKTYPKISAASLICGAILTTLSVYSLLLSFLPSNLKMVLLPCGVFTLIALVLFSWAYFRREKIKDPEKGELISPASIICSDGKENNTGEHYRKAEHELMEQSRKRQEKKEERMMKESLANPGGVRALGEAGAVDQEEGIMMNESLANPGGVRAVAEAGAVDEEEEIMMNDFLAPGL